MENNKEKVFLDTLLEKINKMAHNQNMFPANHDYASKGKLEIEKLEGMEGDKDDIQFVIKYKNGTFERNIFNPITTIKNDLSEEYLEAIYAQLSAYLIYLSMYNIGSVKDECPTISDLIINGENWKEKVLYLKEKGIFVNYRN